MLQLNTTYIDAPFNTLDEHSKHMIFYGNNGEQFLLKYDKEKKSVQKDSTSSFEGYVNYLERVYTEYCDKDSGAEFDKLFDKIMVEHTCPECHGKRLRKQRLCVKVEQKSIHDMSELSIEHLLTIFKEFNIDTDKKEALESILVELIKRLTLLEEMGLGYLSLNQTNTSLSAGELQRIRICTQLGSELQGMLYILDEPSVGLHEKDRFRLVRMMNKLVENGNTVIVIEHDLGMIAASDYVVELGKGAGIHGGEILVQGTQAEVIECKDSIIGDYLGKRNTIKIPEKRRQLTKQSIEIVGARANNLKNVDARIPLGVFACVTGVSGSGKSSLIYDVLYQAICAKMLKKKVIPGKHEKISGVENITGVSFINQLPVGSNANSNVATYLDIFSKIRDLFVTVEDAVEKGYDKSYFSIASNSKGRCIECSGKGYITTELQFMGDVETICPVCRGKRFKEDVLDIYYKGRNISEVLGMEIEEAVDFFAGDKIIYNKLKTLRDLGVGYLRIGDAISSLSGGEIQRLKLAEELGKIQKGKHTLYIMDEPTTGLHIEDVKILLECFHRIVDAGNSLVIIEHNLDIVKTADYVIDLGIDGGRNGGEVIAVGTPEQIAKVEYSYTGQMLKKYL